MWYYCSRLFFFVCVFALTLSGCKQKTKDISRMCLFDADWRFIRDSVTGAEQPGFDDSNWRLLDLPHDWSIEDLPEQIPEKTIGPFSKESEGGLNGQSTGHVVGGTGWRCACF
jgi:beta-galactosidase